MVLNESTVLCRRGQRQVNANLNLFE
jgi:hypothetical protein